MTWREALTRGPGHHHDNLVGLGVARVAGQIDDEWSRPPLEARPDAHGDAVGVLAVDEGDAVGQLVPQVVHGPPPEREDVPVVLVVEPLGVRSHEHDRPPRLAEHHVEDAVLQLSQEVGIWQEQIRNCS